MRTPANSRHADTRHCQPPPVAHIGPCPYALVTGRDRTEKRPPQGRRPHTTGTVPPAARARPATGKIGSCSPRATRSGETRCCGVHGGQRRRRADRTQTNDDLRRCQAIGGGQGRGRTADLPILTQNNQARWVPTLDRTMPVCASTMAKRASTGSPRHASLDVREGNHVTTSH